MRESNGRRIGIGRIFGVLCLLACLLGGQTATRAQGKGVEDVYVWVNADGSVAVGANGREQALPDGPLRAALAQAVGGSLSADTGRADWDLLAHAYPAWARRGAMRRGTINPAPLLPLARAEGDGWVTVSVIFQDLPSVACRGARRFAHDRPGYAGFYAAFPTTATRSRPITFQCGYNAAALTGDGAALLAAWLLPIALTLWVRRRALAAEARGLAFPEMAWFGYGRFLQVLTVGTWLIWIPVGRAVRAYQILPFLCGDGWVRQTGLYYFAFYAPALAIVLCYGLSQPVFARLGGQEWTRRDLMRQSAWGQARLLPLVCFYLAILAGFNQNVRLAAVWLLAALAGRIIAANGTVRAMGTYPVTLTGGLLFQSVQTLAQRAGVCVRRLLLLPAGRGRTANAFAAQGSTVMITETLLQRLSVRETNAVIAHELTHLRRRHPAALLLCSATTLIAAIGASVVVQERTGSSWLGGLAYSVVIPCCLFLTYGLSRRFEHAADAGAVALTGDPEAAMTGLAKLGEINRMPLEWGRGAARWMTHPTTLHRMREIARHGGLSAEDATQIIAHSTAAGDAEADETHYPAPEMPTTALCSAAARSLFLQTAYWTMMLATVLGAMLIARAAPADGSGILVCIFGLFALWVMRELLARGITAAYLRRLERQLRRSKARTGNAPPDALFVGLSPGGGVRLFNGFWEWDFGLLWREDDWLHFDGDRSAFALCSASVLFAESRADLPGEKLPGEKPWSRMCVTWQNAEGNAQFSLRAFPKRCVPALAALVASWRDAPPQSGLIGEIGSPPPDGTQEAGQSPSVLARAALPSAWTQALIGAAAAYAAGLLPLDAVRGWYIALACGGLAFASLLPLLHAKDAPVPPSQGA